MNNRKAGIIQIATALFFAAAIIFTSVLLEGYENKRTIVMLVIALWFIPFGIIETARKKASKINLKSQK